MKGKRILAALMALCLLSCSALAELSFDGSVVSSGSKPVRAPFGGIVGDVKLRAGDLVKVGDTVASMLTTRVYAPQDGVVGSVFAQPGDGAEGITKRYGAVLYIEPVDRYTVAANTEKAYNSSTTKYVHIGERVYLCCTQDGSHRGSARVTGVESADEAGVTKYTLEVTGGDFYIGETVGIFRSADYASSSRIGRGVVGQATAIAVEGTGSILKMHVAAGDTVERGQLLFECVDGTLDGLYAGDSDVVCDVAGIVATVDVQNGATVTKDANLITVYPFDSLQIEAQVDALDIASIHSGDAVEIEFDLDPDALKRYSGTVESISYVSSGEGNQKYYSAYISFEADENVRLGLPAIVYLKDAENSDSEKEGE